MNVCRLSRTLMTPQTSSGLLMRRFFASQKGQVHPGYQKIKEKYEKFQIDDGTPIHLKGGAFDRFLYYTTLVGCGVGLVMTFEYFYSAAFPKKG